MAEIISFGEVARARRRARELECTAACVQILEANLQLALLLYSNGPVEERKIRIRQVRQLAELLEYVVRES